MSKNLYDDWDNPEVDKAYKELWDWDKEIKEVQIIRPAYQSEKQRKAVISLIKNILKKN